MTALRGVRVLDLADESGIFATRMLADLGADVVLVEPPEGSRARHLAPFLRDEPGMERGLLHLYHNANKRSVTVDVEKAQGAERVARLAEGADVLVETAPPGRMTALGLDYESLRARNPRLIYASITPFGQNAEWADWQANDLVACAAGGLLWVSGEPDAPPVQGAANPAFTMASLIAATGVMVALTAREQSPAPEGAHLDISLQEAAAMAVVQTGNATFYEWSQLIPGRPGLSAALRCKDGGWVGFVPRPDRFDAFLAWLDQAGIEHSMTSEDWHWARVGAPGRGNPVAAATRALADTHTREDFCERAFEIDLLCLPITDFPYMAQHPQYLENEQFIEVEHGPLGESLSFVRSPVDAMAGEISIRRAPLLGEHNEVVLGELG